MTDWAVTLAALCLGAMLGLWLGLRRPACEDVLLSSASYDVRLTCPEPTFMLSYAVDVYGVRVDCRCPAGLLEAE